MRRVYITTVVEIGTDDYSLGKNIIDTDNHYTLEDAISYGKSIVDDYLYNRIYKEVDEDLLPDELLEEDKINFIQNLNRAAHKTIRILIEEISGDRKYFTNINELIDYFNSNIKNISNDNLYDFLLSLVCSYNRYYDINGNLEFTRIIDLPLNFIAKKNINFNEEDCKKGIYQFEYVSRK